MRVYIGTTEVAGYYSSLDSILRENGITTHYYTYGKHPFYNVSTSHYSDLEKKLNKLLLKKEKKIQFLIYKFWYFFTEVIKYDAFIFGFTQSVLPFSVDIIILKILGKRIITNIGHGSDARPPILDAAFKKNGLKALLLETIKRRMKVKINYFFADFVIGQPLSSSNFVGANKKLVNWFKVGIPNLRFQQGDRHIEPKLYDLVHIPSDRSTKGTKEILSLINDAGLEVHVFEDMKHEDVILILKKSRILIDQLYSDTPLPTLACEAIKSECLPLVFGSNLELAYNSAGLKKPVSLDFIDAVRYYNENENCRIQFLNELNNFTQNNWSQSKFLKIYKKMLFSEEIEEKYYFNTSKYLGIQPVGMSKPSVQDKLNSIPKFLHKFLLGV